MAKEMYSLVIKRIRRSLSTDNDEDKIDELCIKLRNYKLFLRIMRSLKTLLRMCIFHDFTIRYHRK